MDLDYPTAERFRGLLAHFYTTYDPRDLSAAVDEWRDLILGEDWEMLHVCEDLLIEATLRAIERRTTDPLAATLASQALRITTYQHTRWHA